jgi:hypothetical protein
MDRVKKLMVKVSRTWEEDDWQDHLRNLRVCSITPGTSAKKRRT